MAHLSAETLAQGAGDRRLLPASGARRSSRSAIWPRPRTAISPRRRWRTSPSSSAHAGRGAGHGQLLRHAPHRAGRPLRHRRLHEHRLHARRRLRAARARRGAARRPGRPDVRATGSSPSRRPSAWPVATRPSACRSTTASSARSTRWLRPPGRAARRRLTLGHRASSRCAQPGEPQCRPARPGRRGGICLEKPQAPANPPPPPAGQLPAPPAAEASARASPAQGFDPGRRDHRGAPHRHGSPRVRGLPHHHALPRHRRICRTAQGAPDDSRAGPRRGQRGEPARARRGGLPGRAEVVHAAQGADDLPRRQRRRERAGDVQGPPLDRTGPAPDHRGDDHRRLCRRGRPGLPLLPG